MVGGRGGAGAGQVGVAVAVSQLVGGHVAAHVAHLGDAGGISTGGCI